MNQLYLLGTGTPTPTKQRFGTSSVLELDGEYLMFDCGPAATYKLVKAGLFPTQIDYLFFTHHHFDHNADYPCFLLCRWDQSHGQENRLNVYGPSPTKQITDRLIGPEGAFVDDWKARVNCPVSQYVHKNRGGALPRPEPALNVTDVGHGEVAQGKGWKVTAAVACHVEPWLTTLGYRVDTPGGSIVFMTDTEPCESLAKLAAGCDVLVTNCWDLQETMDANGEAGGQTGTRDSAKMAAEAGAARLILTHTGAHLCESVTRTKALAEIATEYDGETTFTEEGMVLSLW